MATDDELLRNISNGLDSHGRTEAEYLSAYDPSSRYHHPSVTVDSVILSAWDGTLRVLLVRRGCHPFIGRWALPGGFVRQGEYADDAVRREVQEETGEACDSFEQLYTFSKPGRDPRGDVISIAYVAMIPSIVAHTTTLRATGDAIDACWFDVTDRMTDDDNKLVSYRLVPSYDSDLGTSSQLSCIRVNGKRRTGTGLAFDHDEILAMAIDRLANKADYTNVCFAFMPKDGSFTITELQGVFEAVTGGKYDKPNFRKSINHDYITRGLFERTGSTQSGLGHPSATYRFSGDYWRPVAK